MSSSSSSSSSNNAAADADSNSISSELLIGFFQDATNALLKEDNDNDATTTTTKSLESSLQSKKQEIRQWILDIQRRYMTRYAVQANCSESHFESILRQLGNKNNNENNTNVKVDEAMQSMNRAARQAYCRHILQYCLQKEADTAADNDNVKLIDSGTMPKADCMEFLGLVRGTMQLESVQTFLETGQWEKKSIAKDKKFPHDRCEWIQKLLIQHGLGYSSTFCQAQLQQHIVERQQQRGTYNYNNNDDDEDDLPRTILETMQQVQTILQKISIQQLNDFNQGGVTRVVSVTHHDNVVIPQDANRMQDRQEHVTTAFDNNNDKNAAYLMASMQQSILAELLQMPTDERNELLERASNTSRDLDRRLMEVVNPQERIQMLLDWQRHNPQQQRLVLMHKLWTNLLKQHDGQLPRMNPNFGRTRATDE